MTCNEWIRLKQYFHFSCEQNDQSNLCVEMCIAAGTVLFQASSIKTHLIFRYYPRLVEFFNEWKILRWFMKFIQSFKKWHVGVATEIHVYFKMFIETTEYFPFIQHRLIFYRINLGMSSVKSTTLLSIH